MEIRNNQEFMRLVEQLKFKRARTYDNRNPHEHVSATLEEVGKLELIRALNKYVQYHGEIGMFHGRKYHMMYIGPHKYWTVLPWHKAKVLLRNWDILLEDGTVDRSVTLSKRRR